MGSLDVAAIFTVAGVFAVQRTRLPSPFYLHSGASGRNPIVEKLLSLVSCLQVAAMITSVCLVKTMGVIEGMHLGMLELPPSIC